MDRAAEQAVSCVGDSLKRNVTWLQLSFNQLSSKRRTTMTSITEVAQKFFKACEEGKGWQECKAYCETDATFSSQAEPLVGVKSLHEYTDWMKGLFTFVPDARYELRSFGTDD